MRLALGKRRAAENGYRVPDDTRVYAIGDIHGRADLLREMGELVLADAENAGVGRRVLVYLGDFVDRGAASRSVIDFLLRQQLPGFEIVHLTGNHEEMMLAFLDDARHGPLWLANGGGATLRSYGIESARPDPGESLDDRRRMLAEALPPDHAEFLRALSLWHVEGDYMFVHAGIRPGRQPDHQDRSDLLWIRDEFLCSEVDHGKCVVHGHTIAPEVQFRHNRVGIDTGAFATGRLSCLVLEGHDQRVIQTRPAVSAGLTPF